MENEYLKHFDEIFKTNTSGRLKLNMPMLRIIKENFAEDLYRTSKVYETKRREKIEIANQLEKSFTKEQSQLFEKYNELESEKSDELDEQLFMFGYIVGSELSKEIEENKIKFIKDTK